MRFAGGMCLGLVALAACFSEPTEHDVELGETTFANVCARCHGQDGTGGVAQATGVRPRDLTDPAWQASLGDGQIEAIIRIGRNTMPKFQAALSASQIRSVVAKVRRLKRKATP